MDALNQCGFNIVAFTGSLTILLEMKRFYLHFYSAQKFIVNHLETYYINRKNRASVCFSSKLNDTEKAFLQH